MWSDPVTWVAVVVAGAMLIVLAWTAFFAIMRTAVDAADWWALRAKKRAEKRRKSAR